ncbi:hypothetical protein BC827DRAFT_1211233, partial [Russula dissimulans]
MSPFWRYSFVCPPISFISFVYSTVRCATCSTLSATNGNLTARPHRPTFSLSSLMSSMCVLGSHMWTIDTYIKPLKRARVLEQGFI